MLRIGSSYFPGVTADGASPLAPPVPSPQGAPPGVMAAARASALAQGLIVRVQPGAQGYGHTWLVVDPQTGAVVQEIGPHSRSSTLVKLRAHAQDRLDRWA